MSNDKATPRPWEYNATRGEIEQNEERIAKLRFTDEETIDANGRLIVRAVNSHDALVEALEAVDIKLTEEWRNSGAGSSAPVLFYKVRAALSRAKGE